MAWQGRPRPTCAPFANPENAKALAHAAWSEGTAALTHWWVERFKRPPNDPLFLTQTETYWAQWFYQDLLRERERLEGDYQANCGIADSREGAVEQRHTRRHIVKRYNQLGAILGLPSEDPEADIDREEAAARKAAAPPRGSRG